VTGWGERSEEFLALCGVAGLGRLLTEGDATALAELRGHADERLDADWVAALRERLD
jgi:hypothetical protein